jgi:hypothetical protein
VTDGFEPKREEVEIAWKFLQEFKGQLETYKTNKRLKRMLEEKTLSFGPKRKGPNILLNKYLKKSESFFGKISQQAHKYLGIDL